MGPLPGPRRAAPEPSPLSGPRTEQAVCAGLAQLPPASQSKHRPSPRHKQAPQPSFMSLWGWPGTLVPAEDGWHLMPPGPSRALNQQNTRCQAGIQIAGNETFPAQGTHTYWAQRNRLPAAAGARLGIPQFRGAPTVPT